MSVVAGRQDVAFPGQSTDRPGPCASARSDIKPVFALTLFCALVFGAGISAIPVLDRDEARFAQATLQMLESGDFWTVSFQDTARAGGTQIAHWLQAASTGVLSDAAERSIWTYRLPSALAAWIAALFTYFIGRDLFSRRAGLTAALFLAATPTLIAEAHIANADALMLASVTAAHWPLARAYMAGRGGPRPSLAMALFFWVMFAASVLTKGAVGPAVIALLVVSLCIIEGSVRWLGALAPLRGAMLAIAIAAALGWGAGFQPDRDLLERALSGEYLPRLYTGPEMSGGSPPGTHLLFALVALGPALPFVALAAFGLARRWAEPQLRFCVAWAVPAWVMIELIAIKLPHYTLPVFPALTLLAAWQLGRAAPEAPAGERMVLCVWGLLGATVSVSLFGYLAVPSLKPGLESVDVVAVSLINLIGAVALIVFGAAGRQGAAAAIAIATVATVSIVGAAFTFPRIEPFWITERIVEAVQRRDATGRPDAGLVAFGYGEPSLVFRTGTRTRTFGYAAEASEVAAQEASVFAVDGRVRRAFERQSALLGAPRSPATSVTGFNYSSGRAVTIWLYFE